MVETLARTQRSARDNISSESRLVHGEQDLEWFDAVDEISSDSSCKFDGRCGCIHVLHTKHCFEGKCRIQDRTSGTIHPSRGGKLKGSGVEKCEIRRCNLVAVDHDAVNRLQTEISLLKRGIEDLREEFRALKSVLIESETRWRWKSVASGRAV
jgi:hypothetical protein